MLYSRFPPGSAIPAAAVELPAIHRVTVQTVLDSQRASKQATDNCVHVYTTMLMMVIGCCFLAEALHESQRPHNTAYGCCLYNELLILYALHLTAAMRILPPGRSATRVSATTQHSARVLSIQRIAHFVRIALDSCNATVT